MTDTVQDDFLGDVSRNPVNRHILSAWQELDLPNAWLVAGCLFQTVWNLQSRQRPDFGIKDYDIFYFDAKDLSEEAEVRTQDKVNALLGDLGVTIEVANQARVHLWYPTYFGRPYAALASAEEGIGRFLVLETCVGIRPGVCYAPFGLSGVYSGTLSPNPATPYPELFASKVAGYRARWPHLTEQADRSQDLPAKRHTTSK